MENNETPSGGENELRSEGARPAGPVLEWRKRKAEMLVKTRERREFPTADFELREASDGLLRFSGYASVTESPYEVGHFTEVIKSGAFRRTLSQDPDVQLLINHGEGGSGMPIARTGRNMSLTEDERGLRVDAQLDPDDPDVQLLARKMKNGLIDQMSFAFQVAAGDQDWNDEYTERTIRAVSIHRGDVSVVNQGANGASKAIMRSQESLQAVQHRGPEAVMDMIVEVGRFCALPAQQRAGAKISSDSMETLSHCLSLASRADDAVDELQAVLAQYLGVSNPDADGQRSDEAETETPEAPAEVPVDLQKMRRRKQEQQQRTRTLRRLK